MLLILTGIAVMALSGLPGLFPAVAGERGKHVSTAGTLMGGALGVSGLAASMIAGNSPEMSWAWGLPVGRFSVALDSLSAVFLLPTLVAAPLASIYGQGYWTESEHPGNAARLRFFLGLMAGALGMVVVARDAVLFLISWEVMAVAAFFLITAEDEKQSVRESGWLYLAATHLASLALFAAFALWHSATGSFALEPAGSSAGPSGLWTAIFLLSLLGFGLKAGLMPFHVWLPGAHANAPSHVSALMSGVLIKMGVYGLVRMTAILPMPPVHWGSLLLLLGTVSAVLGVAYAIAQHDLKRLLAYHSVENIGIIFMGLGLALVGRSLERGDWIAFGLAGALLHVWNHGIFKFLLFLGAGAVIHAAGTREMDLMGGLAKRMPRTAALFLVGAVAICGLPPLNGFVSEFLIYLGLFQVLQSSHAVSWGWPAFAVPFLAMTGALAVACFVKVYGVVFLGEPRSEAGRDAHDPPAPMIAPMVVLAGGCFFIGLVPWAVMPLLGDAVSAWAPGADPQILSMAPMGWISAAGGSLLGGAAVAFVWLRRRAAAAPRAGTWDCGCPAPSPRMQYTASSFGQFLVSQFAWALRPRVHKPELAGLFPAAGRFESRVDDVMLKKGVAPAWRWSLRAMGRLRFLQQGRIQVYVLYVAAFAVVLLAVSMGIHP